MLTKIPVWNMMLVKFFKEKHSFMQALFSLNLSRSRQSWQAINFGSISNTANGIIYIKTKNKKNING